MIEVITVGYFVLALAVILTLSFGLKKYASKKAALYALIIPIGWCVITYILSALGLLEGLELPPKIPVFVVGPAFVIWVSLLLASSSRKALLKLPLTFIIALQTLRIFVELLFHAQYELGTFPIEGTFLGDNFDIWGGLTAVPMALLVYNNKISKWIIYAWNLFGILVLLNTVRMFITLVYAKDVGDSALLAMDNLNKYPALIVPSLLMPFAIFLHVLTFIKLKKTSNSN